ncbi:MFS transporter, partial [Microbispora rosea]
MGGSTSAARPGGIVSVMAVAGIVASLMQTLVVPLIGELPNLLRTTASNASWVITVTLLAGAVTTPVTGRLGDLYGKRRMMLVCSVPLIAGCVVAVQRVSVHGAAAGQPKPLPARDQSDHDVGRA